MLIRDSNRRVRARCNKRSCQARRTLNKPIEEYAERPKCHKPGCDGLMYEDKYRTRKGDKDRAPMCRDDCRPFPHRIDDPHCKHYSRFVEDRYNAPRSRHSPCPDDLTPF